MSSKWKIIFGIIWDDLLIAEVKLKLCLIFQNFQNGRHFEVAINFFLLEAIPEVRYASMVGMSIFNIFGYLIDALAEISMEI